MKTKQSPSGSIVLMASTSGYFGGTGVTAYVASKHGVVGLLRASQNVAQQYGFRVNAVAPFFTPTRLTAGFAHWWEEAGLEANTPQRVAETIACVAMDESRNGSSVLIEIFACGNTLILSGGWEISQGNGAYKNGMAVGYAVSGRKWRAEPNQCLGTGLVLPKDLSNDESHSYKSTSPGFKRRLTPRHPGRASFQAHVARLNK
ncbi:hypothetical protein APSETT444_007782 [Aspergillus pseudonomiae]